jgi:hypothetical protein
VAYPDGRVELLEGRYRRWYGSSRSTDRTSRSPREACSSCTDGLPSAAASRSTPASPQAAAPRPARPEQPVEHVLSIMGARARGRHRSSRPGVRGRTTELDLFPNHIVARRRGRLRLAEGPRPRASEEIVLAAWEARTRSTFADPGTDRTGSLQLTSTCARRRGLGRWVPPPNADEITSDASVHVLRRHRQATRDEGDDQRAPRARQLAGRPIRRSGDRNPHGGLRST